MRTHLVRITAEGEAALARWQEEEKRHHCTTCDGTGWEVYEFWEGGYHNWGTTQCRTCKGTGKVEVA